MKLSPSNIAATFKSVAEILLFKKAHDREAFTEALRHAEFDVLKKMIDQYPEAIDWVDGENGGKALHTAGWGAHSDDIFEYLISHGAKVNEKRNDGETPLLCAAGIGNIDAMCSLLRRGAEINAQDKDGYTPLMRAAFQWDSKLKSTKFLISNGARLDIKNKNGDTVLDIVKKKGSAGSDGNILPTLIRAEAAEKHRKETRKKEAKRKLKDAAMAVFHTGLPHGLRRPKLRLKKKPGAGCS